MNEINHGGPAFPVPLAEGQAYQGHAPCDGMTLRDYFAAKAMQGLQRHFYGDSDVNDIDIARMAFQQADAMLRARGDEAPPAMDIANTWWPVKQMGIHHPSDPPTIMTLTDAQHEPEELDAYMALELIAADADAGNSRLTSGVRAALDAALIKAGRKEAPVRTGE
jgi:hypothetical protein